jgi:hypothetical protein
LVNLRFGSSGHDYVTDEVRMSIDEVDAKHGRGQWSRIQYKYNKAGQLALYIGSVWLGSAPVVTARLGFGSAKTDLPKQDEPSRAKPFSRLSSWLELWLDTIFGCLSCATGNFVIPRVFPFSPIRPIRPIATNRPIIRPILTNPHVTSGVRSPVPSESLSPSRPSPSERPVGASGRSGWLPA